MGATDSNNNNQDNASSVNHQSFSVRVQHLMSEVMRQDLVAIGGAKYNVVQHINIEGFIRTLRSTGMLTRDDTTMEGHLLNEYKLDPKFADLVPPRGVYCRETRLANNLMEFGLDESVELLTPPQFMQVQAEILGSVRLSDNLSTDLLEASKSMAFDSALELASLEGSCHYNDVPYLPIEFKVAGLFAPTWFTFDSEDMVRLFLVEFMKGLKFKPISRDTGKTQN